ncbi:MAG: ABC transporter ATP-binding protein [Gammaproteobacteria bacterium]|nr:MAG: ABC transporter ATP-binding protein [Gammaproteobacteria bacterium]
MTTLYSDLNSAQQLKNAPLSNPQGLRDVPGNILKDANQPTIISPDLNATQAAIQVSDLRKTYGEGNQAVDALRGVSLTVFPGEVVGVLGPNGAGKTTLMEILEGLRKPSHGTLQILGNDIGSRAHTEARKKIGVAVQNSVLPPLLTVAEILKLQASLFGPQSLDVEAIIEAVVLGDKRNSRVQQLSGGQQQRVALALALVGNPEILFLDEPTSQLDPQARRQVWNLVLRQRNHKKAAVLITTHQMEEAEKLCDRVFILDNGQILAQGRPDDLINQYCPEQTLEFTVREKFSNALFAQDAQPTFTQQADGNFSAVFKNKDINGVFRILIEQHIIDIAAITQAKVTKQTLEDVFIKLTGRGIRD